MRNKIINLNQKKNNKRKIKRKEKYSINKDNNKEHWLNVNFVSVMKKSMNILY